MNAEQGFQLSDLFGMARRRGKLVAVVAGVVILATFWISMALPNLYMSYATILVEPQSIDESLVNAGVRESDLNMRLGLMTAEILSRGRLSKIIDEFDLYGEESKKMERQEVIDLMRSYVSVEPVLNELETGNRRNRDVEFNTFKIIYRNESRRLAAAVAQRIAQDFINANIQARTTVTSKSLEFMQDEMSSLSEQVARVEKAIADVKAESAGRLPEDMQSNQRMLQFAMADLRDAQRVYDSARSDAAFWNSQALTASTMSSPGDQNSPGYRRRSLELELGNMVARGFTEKHPDIVRVQSEIALLEEQLSREPVEEEEEGAESPPSSIAEQNARSEQRRAELRAESASQDIERLREVVADLEARIAATPAVAERLDALNRQYAHLSETYQDFSRRRQQAGVQADLERRQLGEKFRILESAFEAPAPSSPNRILLLVLGTILGLGLGMGIGVLAEVADTSIHTSNELQTALGIPVLVSVPRIMLESDRAARTRRIWREGLAAAAVVLFCLVGGGATYLLVNGGAGDASQAEQRTPARPEARANPDVVQAPRG
jgi:polysaccharide chain length determinant protein (PEP-CTERM system associated)